MWFAHTGPEALVAEVRVYAKALDGPYGNMRQLPSCNEATASHSLPHTSY